MMNITFNYLKRIKYNSLINKKITEQVRKKYIINKKINYNYHIRRNFSVSSLPPPNNNDFLITCVMALSIGSLYLFYKY